MAAAFSMNSTATYNPNYLYDPYNDSYTARYVKEVEKRYEEEVYRLQRQVSQMNQQYYSYDPGSIYTPDITTHYTASINSINSINSKESVKKVDSDKSKKLKSLIAFYYHRSPVSPISPKN